MADETMADGAELQPLQPGSLLLVLRDAQAQHGLRHGDYARYRCVASPARAAWTLRLKHCTRIVIAGSIARAGCCGCTRCWAFRTEEAKQSTRTARWARQT